MERHPGADAVRFTDASAPSATEGRRRGLRPRQRLPRPRLHPRAVSAPRTEPGGSHDPSRQLRRRSTPHGRRDEPRGLPARGAAVALRRRATAVHPPDPAREPPPPEDGETVTAEDVEKVARWDATAEPSSEITFAPARVLLQDFHRASRRSSTWRRCADAMAAFGGDPSRIDPLIPAELVIDHSVRVDDFASRLAIRRNAELRVPSQPRAVRVPPLGPGRLRRAQGRPRRTRASATRSASSSCARVVERATGRRSPTRSSGPTPHDDGQRPGRPRLGRRRDRGRGGDARRGDLDARPAGRRLPPPRPAAGRRDGHSTSSSP